MGSHLDEWQPLNVRYGRADPVTWNDKGEWSWRHRWPEPVQPYHVAKPPDDRVRCICPGSTFPDIAYRCRQRATQEDAICDECRQWCIAADSNGDVHLIAALRPATTSTLR